MGTTLYDGYSYRAKVSNGAATLTSSPATLTVQPIVLKIKTHPKTVKTDEYKTVTFKVKAVGAIHFQWQSWYPGDSRWYDMEGATSDTLSLFVESYEDDASFRCAVSNDRGDVEYSNPAKVYLKLSIQEQPKSVTTEEGTAAWFYVDAAGATSYQWQYLVPNGKDWTDWSGHTDSYVGVGGTLNNNGYSFRCRVSNASMTKYTKAAKLTVNPKVHYRALLIGESNYSSNPLAGGVYNADTMAGMLRGLNNSFTTTTLKNASSTQIINGISTAFAGASDYDVSLFYYSGHGAESSSTYYLGALCPVSGYSITFDELAWELSKVKGRVIVILDSCHSGAAIGKSVEDDKAAAARLDAYNQSAIDAFSGYRLESGDGETGKWKELATSKFVVITSASSSEVCWNRIVNYGYDGNSYPQGLFTAAFIKGMGCSYPNGYYSGNRMPADKNKDNVITLKEIYNYVYDLALVWTKSNGLSAQHTKFYGNASEVLFRRK